MLPEKYVTWPKPGSYPHTGMMGIIHYVILNRQWIGTAITVLCKMKGSHTTLPRSEEETQVFELNSISLNTKNVPETWDVRGSHVTNPPSKILSQNCSCLKEMQRQRVEQRLKERPSRDCLTWGSTPSADNKPRHYCWCQEVLDDRSLLYLSPKSLCQSLKKADAHNKPMDWA